jgi:hypothetical protein
LSLLQDENIRYALAYAYFRSGNFPKAETHLTVIRDASLFNAAVQLRKAMEECKNSGWECA